MKNLFFKGLQLNAYQKWFNAYQNAYLKKEVYQIFGKHEKWNAYQILFKSLPKLLNE